jgi:PA-IL-like protein
VKEPRAIACLGPLILLLTIPLAADTLVMRDGRRVRGELVAVRDGIVEFEGQRGFLGARERIRVDRADVTRIELDDADSGDRGNRFDRDDPDRGRDSGSGSPARPGGLRERQVTVNASEPWSDTGLVVRAGQTLYFNASGRVRWGPGRQDGPAGERSSPRNDARPIPGRPAAALIGRVGESDDYFLIGDDTAAIRVRDGGRLYLGINDDFLQDNSGSFRVTIYY